MTTTTTLDPAGDLVAALTSLTDPPKDGAVNAGQRRYRYLELTDLLAEVRAKMGAHNWAILQIPDVVDGHVVVTNLWIHASGEKITHPPFALPCGRSPQEIGSALTYARRYSLASLVGLAGSDDDDAQHAQRATQASRRAPQADRDTVDATRPVARAHAAPDDPANEPYQTPPDPGGAGAEEGPGSAPPRRPRTLADTHTTTTVPYTGHQAHQHGASDASVRKMWALLRATGWDAKAIRDHVAQMLDIDPNWHTSALTQRQVSVIIDAMQTNPPTRPAEGPHDTDEPA